MRIAVILFVMSVLLTILIVRGWWMHGTCSTAATATEGFVDRPSAADIANPLGAMIKKLTHMSKYFADTNTWRDRLTTAFMSPTELARHYIKQQKKQKKE